MRWGPPLFKVANCDLKETYRPASLRSIEPQAQHYNYFFFWTLAATFNRSAFNRMKPVASSWL